MILLLWLMALAGTALSAVFSGLETGLYRLNRIRLRLRAERGEDRRAQVLRSLLAQPEALLATVLLGNNLANYLATGSVSKVLMPLGELTSVIVTTAVVTPVLFILGEVTPKNIFRRNPDLFCYPLARPLRWLGLALWPAVVALRSIGRIAAAFFHAPPAQESTLLTRSSLAFLLSESEETGTLSAAQGRLAESIVIRHRFRVRDLMVPISEAGVIDETTAIEDLLAKVTFEAEDLVLLYRRRPNNVVGAVWLNDLLFSERSPRAGKEGKDDELELTPFTQAVVRVPEHWPVDQALWFLQTRRSPVGVVVDRSDEVEGLVTLPRLVERFAADLAARGAESAGPAPRSV